ncbi:MAG TPA: hypothetical protein VFH80_08485 [Solirubrobacteraceae bacterium]|nr:hypothetical protein [Solirubrobacteraceae bacterium]
MSGELEQRLLALGVALDVPPAPDTVPAVLAGLPARRRRPGRPAGRVLAVAFAAMLLLVGVAMAVPPSRDAILRVIGLRGVSIERVPRLPSIPAGARTGDRLGLGRPISLAHVRHAAGFTPLLPSRASGAYIGHDVPGGRVSILVGRVLITEFRGTARPFIFKVIDPGTSVKIARVNGAQGVYLSGAPHQVLFGTTNGQIRGDRVRLAGNVLIWQDGPLIVRIEGTHTLAQALAIARSLRG